MLSSSGSWVVLRLSDAVWLVARPVEAPFEVLGIIGRFSEFRVAAIRLKCRSDALSLIQKSASDSERALEIGSGYCDMVANMDKEGP